MSLHSKRIRDVIDATLLDVVVVATKRVVGLEWGVRASGGRWGDHWRRVRARVRVRCFVVTVRVQVR